MKVTQAWDQEFLRWKASGWIPLENGVETKNELVEMVINY